MSNQLTIEEKPNKKSIESLDLTQNVNLLRLWRGKLFLATRIKFTKHQLKKLYYLVLQIIKTFKENVLWEPSISLYHFYAMKN